jgi:hypothetical protein
MDEEIPMKKSRFTEARIGDLVPEGMGPRPKHVVDRDPSRVPDDTRCGGVDEQGLQAADVVVKKPLGCIVNLVAGRIPEEVGALCIDKALAVRTAEAAVQPRAPAFGNVA